MYAYSPLTIHALQMKISPPDPGLLSLNTSTVRERWSLRETIEGCARRGISPWRDKLVELGVSI